MRTKELLDFYSREDVSSAIVSFGKDREVVGRRLRGDYNKRPDILAYPGDVHSLARGGVTSFHASVELWRNPLSLVPGMARKEIDENRAGWDFLIDLDSKVDHSDPFRGLEYSKIAANVLMQALDTYGLEEIPIKFSGKAGFHIFIPFGLFPRKWRGVPVESAFPELPRLMGKYLTQLCKEKVSEDIEETFGKQSAIDDARTVHEREVAEIDRLFRAEIQKQADEQWKGGRPKQELVAKLLLEDPAGHKLRIKNEYHEKHPSIDNFGIVKIDSVLISPRHLVRAPYSFNEKSWLVSIPVEPKKILKFDPETARPENIGKVRKFEGGRGSLESLIDLLPTAFSREETRKEYEEQWKTSKVKSSKGKYLPDALDERPKIKLSESVFPPCIMAIFSETDVEDGRKRRLFILQGFLQSAGWSAEEISEKCNSWNSSLKNPLPPVYIEGQLSYMGRSRRDKGLVAPNCETDGFYREMGICRPDSFCSGVKNPITSAFRRLPKKRISAPEPKKARKARGPARKGEKREKPAL